MDLIKHNKAQTEDYLVYRRFPIMEGIMESVMLPSVEMLLLTQKDENHTVSLLNFDDEEFPVCELESNITSREAPYALGYWAEHFFAVMR